MMAILVVDGSIAAENELAHLLGGAAIIAAHLPVASHQNTVVGQAAVRILAKVKAGDDVAPGYTPGSLREHLGFYTAVQRQTEVAEREDASLVKGEQTRKAIIRPDGAVAPSLCEKRESILGVADTEDIVEVAELEIEPNALTDAHEGAGLAEVDPIAPELMQLLLQVDIVVNLGAEGPGPDPNDAGLESLVRPLGR